MKKPAKLTKTALCRKAAEFSEKESRHREKSLFGVTDGKAVGTYFEHKFIHFLQQSHEVEAGNSAKGIDLPGLGVDIKVTSIRQPQSSCPFRTARQKIFGLGYSLLVFVYDKQDDARTRTGRLTVCHSIFVERERTADYQMTTGLLSVLKNHGNADDLMAFMMDRHLPIDEMEALKIAQEILETPPATGYLTISNALQWRLQYKRVIALAGTVNGLRRIR